ncbi:MAG TPA: hypothetical protein VEJ89_05990 [Myxococcaceae bacterium]|jgi:hypothetical protein|nr:hypothetical protein [Myxococcaceae bacterium]
MSDKDLAREVETALGRLPDDERDRLVREGGLRLPEELLTLGLAASL